MKRWLCGLATAGVLTALGAPVEAHVPRTVGGQQWEVGWQTEPPLAGEPNAITVSLPGGAAGSADFRVTVSVGGRTSDAFALEPVDGTSGVYRAALIPTIVGAYTVRVYGKVGPASVDETFTAKQGLEEVQGTSRLAFPKDAPTTSELVDRIAVLEQDLEDAKSASKGARPFGAVGFVLAVVALVFAIRRRP
jgi:hypothetical protein